MAAYTLDRLGALQDADVAHFRRTGFLVVENVLSAERIARLRESFPKLFAGKFDTGVYPDEWYWRDGMSLPDVTRHMANAWKADLTLAKWRSRPMLGAPLRASRAGREHGSVRTRSGGSRRATKPVAYHQDLSFMNFLDPPQTVTCWVTLDETHPRGRDIGICAGLAFVAADADAGRISRAGGLPGADEGRRSRGRCGAPGAGVISRCRPELRSACRRDLARLGPQPHRGSYAALDRHPFAPGGALLQRPPRRVHLPPVSAHRRSRRWTKAFFRFCGRSADTAPNG